MSHYPSTAELASFRTYMTQGRIVPISFSDHATDAELLRGIGYRLYRSPMPIGYGTVAAIGEHDFRREASRMRHDFYWLNLCIVCKVWNGPEGCDCYGPAI